jgi:hypothetical protein
MSNHPLIKQSEKRKSLREQKKSKKEKEKHKYHISLENITLGFHKQLTVHLNIPLFRFLVVNRTLYY